MRGSPLATLTVTVVLALLAGCDARNRLFLSPEDKINAAFPVSEAVRNARAALAEQPGDAPHRALDEQYGTRLKLRALNCGNGYVPSRFDAVDTVRKHIGNGGCFNDVDASIARWLGFHRVAVGLAKEPLTVIPAKAPAFIVADDAIQSVRFADKAGIALIQTAQAIEVVGFESARPLYREARGASAIGALSSNGRVFAVGDGQHLLVKESESGATLLDLPSVRITDFAWLGSRSALYTGGPERKAMLIDFASGKEVPIGFMSANASVRVGNVEGSENQFLLFSGRTIRKVELTHDQADPEVKLIAEKPTDAFAWMSYGAEPSVAGGRHFAAIRDLVLVSSDTLETEVVSFAPFALQTGTATPDPDRIILVGSGPSSAERGARSYVVSLADRTLAPIETSKLPSTRYLYIASLHKQGVISDNKITVLDDVPTLAPIAIEQFRSDALQVANGQKLEQFARQQAALTTTQDPPRPPPYGVPLPMPMPYAHGPRGAVADAAAAPGSVLEQLARDAQVEAIGVYQSGPRPAGGNAHPTGYVEVRVRRTTKPLVLVLSSYEPVRWLLVSDSGARLAAVLLSGPAASQVVGAGPARVVVNGNAFAYKLGGREYEALDQQTVRLLGKRIGLFQGRYDGGPFTVGG